MNAPQLASTHVGYTSRDAIRDLANAPSHYFTIQVFLRARDGSNFGTVAYTEQVKHFLGVCLSGDSDFTILKKRKKKTQSLGRMKFPLIHLSLNKILLERSRLIKITNGFVFVFRLHLQRPFKLFSEMIIHQLQN